MEVFVTATKFADQVLIYEFYTLASSINLVLKVIHTEADRKQKQSTKTRLFLEFSCIFQAARRKRKIFKQSWKSIWRLVHVSFTISETEPEYYHQRVNVKNPSGDSK